MTVLKTSGIEWVGDIPSHWEVKPLFAIGHESKQKNRDGFEANLLSLSYGEIVEKDIESNSGLLPESFDTYQKLEPNDLVFRLTDLQNDKRSLRSARSNHSGIITSAYLTFRPTKCDSRYLAYLMRSYDLTKVFYSMGSGLRQSLKYSDFKRMPILLPPIEEQRAIADFLDREIGKIDLLIEKQKSLINLLEYRFVTEVETQVVGGAIADSWLSSLPVGWKQVPLRTVADIAAGGTPSSEVEQYWVGSDDQDGIAWLGIGDFTENGAVLTTERRLTLKGLQSKRLPLGKPGTILYAMYASVGSVSKLGIEGSWSQAILGVSPKNGVNGEYLYWALRAVKKQLPFYYRSNTQNNVNANQVKALKIPFPPLDEQKIIAEKLEASSELTQIAIYKCSELMQKLQLKKNALISAAVTGKVSVRGN